jgi:carbohydrate-binding DOMON domain-containing protein
MGDPKGDDKGPGRYEYPTSFQGRFGFLDITRFRALDADRFVEFEVEFRRPVARVDGTTEAKNYWLQLVDIYVDQDGRPGSGHTWALPGRNLVFDGSSGWEKVVLVTPGHSRALLQLVRDRSSEQELQQNRHDVIVPERVYPQAYSLKIMVPKADLGGEPQPHWGYQVLALGYNPRNLAYRQLQNMQVQRFADEEHFGGGTDYQGDPNVIDLLAPSKEVQYRWLSDYSSHQHREASRLAVVPMVRAGGATPASTGAPEPRPAPSREPPTAPPVAPVPASPRPEAASPEPAGPQGEPPTGNTLRRDLPLPGGTGPDLSEPFSFELEPGAKF